MNLEQMNIFEGKTVSFSSETDTLAIKNISFNLIHDKLFVTGQMPLNATKEDLALNKECAISWDSVTDYIIFESEKEFSKWVEATET